MAKCSCYQSSDTANKQLPVAAVLAAVVITTTALIFMTAGNAPRTGDVAIVLTRPWGNGNDSRRVDVDLVSRMLATNMVPQPSPQMIVVDPTELHGAVEDLYSSGTRVFVGTFMTSELEAILPFAHSHRDVLFISTASTAVAMSRIDNVCRLSNPDYKVHDVVTAIISSADPDSVVIYMDPLGTWSSGLSTAIQLVVSTRAPHLPVHVVNSTHIGKNDAVPSGNAIVFAALEDPVAFLHTIPASWPSLTYVLGDIIAFEGNRTIFKTIKNVDKVYSFVSYTYNGASEFTEASVGSVTPFVSQLVKAVEVALHASGKAPMNAVASDGMALFPIDAVMDWYGPGGLRLFNHACDKQRPEYIVLELSLEETMLTAPWKPTQMTFDLMHPYHAVATVYDDIRETYD